MSKRIIDKIVLADGSCLQKNKEVMLSIEDMSETGEGIGKKEGYTFFVKNAVIGDEVNAHITKLLKNYGYAKVKELITPSPYRVTPRCEKAAPCGGCQLQELSYEGQLEFKYKKVRSHIDRIAGMSEVPVFAVKGMDNPFSYRNKSQYPIRRGKDGKIIIGFYAGRTHEVIEAENCYLNMGKDKEILSVIKQFMIDFKIAPYEEEQNRGCVRHIMIRYAMHTGQIMVCLVVAKNELRGELELVKRLTKIEGMASICLNVNQEKTNVIFGRKMKQLYGKEYIVDSIGYIQYQISAQSFYQVNPIQTKVLYETAMEYAGLTGKEIVWDLYCGIGTISLFLAQKAKKVYGVEIVPSAIENAKENARLNEIKNVEFFLGKAEKVLPREYEKNKICADVIVTDPPRKGCEKEVLDTMVQMKPERIVYVSCNSATLARDVKYLAEYGYKVEKVQPVDMFAQTVHVETVVLMSKVR